jgi:MFS superfamily sulfate permease-like transporter
MTVLAAATLIYLLRKTMYPRDALLGRIPGRDGFYDMARFPDAVGIEGAAICLIQGSVLFYNADYVRTRLRDIAQNLPANTRRLVLDDSAIVHLDSTGALALDAVHAALREQGIIFGMAELNAEAKALLERAGVAKHFGTENFFDDKEYVVRTFRLQEERNDMPARDGGEGQTRSPREGSHEQGA